MYVRLAWSNTVDLSTCRVVILPMGTEYICGPVGIGVPVQGLLLPASFVFVFVITSWYLLMLSSIGTPSLIDRRDQYKYSFVVISWPRLIWVLGKVSAGMVYASWMSWYHGLFLVFFSFLYVIGMVHNCLSLFITTLEAYVHGHTSGSGKRTILLIEGGAMTWRRLRRNTWVIFSHTPYLDCSVADHAYHFPFHILHHHALSPKLACCSAGNVRSTLIPV